MCYVSDAAFVATDPCMPMPSWPVAKLQRSIFWDWRLRTPTTANLPSCYSPARLSNENDAASIPIAPIVAGHLSAAF
jgi:hypothetical protein